MPGEEFDDGHLVALLDAVMDLNTFLEFLGELASQRRAAEGLEAGLPGAIANDGALGWKNMTICAFLFGSMAYFTEAVPPFSRDQPNWQDLAQFLYFGKCYES